MAGMIGIIVYFTIHRPVNHETPLAKQSEFLNGKRSQNTVCPPSYKNEIQNLGNESKYLLWKIVLVRPKSFWSGPNHFGQVQIRLF